MTEMTKKLHFLKNGTEQTAKAYSTTEEAGSSYIPSKIDGVACYIPIGSIGDAMATNGRVIKTLYVKKVMVDEPWQQPVLSANGTMGGSKFACAVSAYKLVNSGTVADAYGAFDNNTNTYWRSGTTSGWIQFYNPVPLKVSAIKWGCFYSYPTGGNVQGSNDGTTWTTLNTWTNSSAADFTINISTQQYYKYYRINVTRVNKDVIHVHSLTITATYQKEVETYVGEHDDYDYSITDTYAIKSQAKPAYAEQSWITPGTYTWTAPVGITRVRVAVCGGGGTGCNFPGEDWGGNTRYYTSDGGDTSSFNGVSATGGTAGEYSSGKYVDGEDEQVYCDYWPGTGGKPNGKNNNTGFALSFTASNGDYGKGGYGGSLATVGGSGGYNSTYVNVTAGKSYTVVVGSGGVPGGGKRLTGYKGTSGFVLIAYGGDI